MPLGAFRLNSLAKVLGRTAKALTAAGNAIISTAQSKFGTGSGYFDGTGDKVSTPYVSDFVFTGDFTVECWINQATPTTVHNTVIGNQSGSSGFGGVQMWALRTRISNGTQLSATIRKSDGNYLDILTNFSVSNSTWRHIAMVRSGSTITLYADGVAKATGSYAGVVGSTSTPLTIGGNDSTDGNERYYVGYIDEVRISTIARYTSNFTPSTSAFVNDASTVLLVHCNGINGSTTFNDDA